MSGMGFLRVHPANILDIGTTLSYKAGIGPRFLNHHHPSPAPCSFLAAGLLLNAPTSLP